MNKKKLFATTEAWALTDLTGLHCIGSYASLHTIISFKQHQSI